MSPAFVALHIALVIAAAFLVGVRAYREIHPQAIESDDSKQLHKLARSASIGLVALLVAALVALDLSLIGVARMLP